MLIYCIENIINNKCYIGQTTQTLPERKSHHLYEFNMETHYNNYLQNSWNKYGEESFNFFILEDGFETIDELNNAEEFWINVLQTMYYQDGYNIKFGGNNSKHSHLIKQKISKANSKYKNIGVYSEKGKLLTKHKTLEGIYKKYNIKKHYIRSVLSNINKSSHGYIFKEICYDNPQTNIKEYRYRNKHYVGKYNLNGQLIKIFTDVNSINLKNYNPNTIRSACCKSIKSYKGYMWRGNKNKNKIPKKIPPYKIIHHENKKVIKYDLDGYYVDTYNSLINGAQSVGFNFGNNIGLCCRGEKKSAGGYQWRYWKKNFPKKIKPYKSNSGGNNARKINQFTLDGKHIKTFDSLANAAHSVGLKTSTPVGECCRDNYKTSMGYNWEYVNN